MKQYLYFYFDDNKRFRCDISYKGHQRNLKHRDAKEKLDEIDEIKYDKFMIENDKLIMENKNTCVSIDGISEFYKRDYNYNIQKINREFSNHIRAKLYRKNEFNPIVASKIPFFKNISTYSYRIKRVVLGSGLGVVVLASLAFTPITEELTKEEYFKSQVVYDDMEILQDYGTNYLFEPEDFEIQPIVNEDTSSKDVSLANNQYYDIVQDEATRWGLDPNLVMAMLTQESHGKGTNIMQISRSDWCNKKLKMYDFVDNKYVTICISTEEFDDPRMNIRLGCAILRHSIERMNNHIIAGTQNYNVGDGNMDCVIRHATSDLEISKEELLADQDDLSFIDYVHYASGGDKQYIKHVFRYIDDVDCIYYKTINEQGDIEEYRYDLNVKELTK